MQSYSGHASHAGDFAERKRVSIDALGRAAEIRDAMGRAGLSTEIWSGGSTGTWDIDTEFTKLTELQAGSYALMDLDYRRVGADFPHSLTVLATVVSANHSEFVTVDAGLKAFATDRGYGPEAVGLAGSVYRWGGDEFGYLDLRTEAGQGAVPRGHPEPGGPPHLGAKIEFIPPHCDPTMNLYDRIYACRGDSVDGIWRIK